ncbi:hypothetical protein AB1Y20_006946 [Prymnesium parvum]|uniref:Centrosomal protein of 162 kDa n=1 Tax=Prymnesium parvum TaxID=97485 RepID=A0AB34IZG7_PRYPA
MSDDEYHEDFEEDVEEDESEKQPSDRSAAPSQPSAQPQPARVDALLSNFDALLADFKSEASKPQAPAPRAEEPSSAAQLDSLLSGLQADLADGAGGVASASCAAPARAGRRAAPSSATEAHDPSVAPGVSRGAPCCAANPFADRQPVRSTAADALGNFHCGAQRGSGSKLPSSRPSTNASANEAEARNIGKLARANSSLQEQVRKATRDLARALQAKERISSAKQQRPTNRPPSKPGGAAKAPKKDRPYNTPDHEREARQLTNASKQLAYYSKESEQLKRKLARAQAMGEHLSAVEASVKAQQEALTEAQKKGRELLMRQKEQARALGSANREDPSRKIAEMRADLRVIKERTRKQLEQNEHDSQQIALLESKCADMEAELKHLQEQYHSHQAAVENVNDRSAAEVAAKDKRAAQLEAAMEAENNAMLADRAEQKQLQLQLQGQVRAARSALTRMQDLIRERHQEEKLRQLRAKEEERAREAKARLKKLEAEELAAAQAREAPREELSTKPSSAAPSEGEAQAVGTGQPGGGQPSVSRGGTPRATSSGSGAVGGGGESEAQARPTSSEAPLQPAETTQRHDEAHPKAASRPPVPEAQPAAAATEPEDEAHAKAAGGEPRDEAEPKPASAEPAHALEDADEDVYDDEEFHQDDLED